MLKKKWNEFPKQMKKQLPEMEEYLLKLELNKSLNKKKYNTLESSQYPSDDLLYSLDQTYVTIKIISHHTDDGISRYSDVFCFRGVILVVFEPKFRHSGLVRFRICTQMV